MTHKINDHGLSEVIGFVLILALVIVAISLWMTYVLPAQGRELEISHMDEVGEWFLDYKIAVDSLWMNNEIGVTDSTTLTLGSKGGNTQTSGLFLPMMQPIGSSGSLASTSTLDYITVTNRYGQVEKIPMTRLSTSPIIITGSSSSIITRSGVFSSRRIVTGLPGSQTLYRRLSQYIKLVTQLR